MTAQDVRFNLRGDRLEMTAATVGDILDMWNGAQLHRVVGGPAWMRTDRFDIVAKADRPIAGADSLAAVMALLAERFQLQSHKETRDTPDFTIRAPKIPQGLKPAASDEKYSVRTTDGDVAFTAASMSMLTNYLSQMWGAPVEDQTKLDGRYDFTLATSRTERHAGERWADWVREAIEDAGFRGKPEDPDRGNGGRSVRTAGQKLIGHYFWTGFSGQAWRGYRRPSSLRSCG